MLLQPPAHQFQRHMLVAPTLDQNVQRLTLGVRRPPWKDRPTIDLEISSSKCQAIWGFGRRKRRSATIFDPKWSTQRRTL
jgi:hypothetical protein